MNSKTKESIKICRLCTKNVELNDIQNDLFEKCNQFLLHQIKELTGIALKHTLRLNYPRYICSKCKDELSSSFEFRNRIIKSQNYFKSKEYQEKIDNPNESDKAGNPAHLFDSVFVPSFGEVLDIKNFSNNSSGYEDNDITAENCLETVLDVKTEKIETSKTKNKIKQTKTRKRLIKSQKDSSKKPAIPIKKERNNDVEIEVEPQQINDTKLESFSDESNEEFLTLKKDLSDNSSLEDNDNSEDSDFEIARSHLQKIALAIAEKENDTEDVKKFQNKCNLCEKYFKTKFLLSAHWNNQHKGEKKCNQCDEKFLTRKAFEKHIRWHEGKEAYKCRYCDLTFKYTNGRTKHERKIHSRDCGYLCPICGKTFTTSDLGKNHMVVHTKVRAFRCTVCNASFLRKTHLTTHYRSETHKNNTKKLNMNVETLPAQTPQIKDEGQCQNQLTTNMASTNVQGYETSEHVEGFESVQTVGSCEAPNNVASYGELLQPPAHQIY